MKRFQFLEADSGSNSTTGTGGGTLLSSAPAQAAPVTTAPATTGGTSWIKDDGTFGEGWQSKLPEDIRNADSLKVMGSFTDLAKSYVATKAMVGKKLEAPREDATPEQIAAWRKTVGAPDDVQGYYGDAKTLRPDSVPEALWNADSEKAFLAIAHKHHLPVAAVKDILAFQGEITGQAVQQSEAEFAKFKEGQIATLRKEWGGEFDGNIELAKRVAQTVGLDPMTNEMFQKADVVQAFAKLGKLFSEDKIVKGDTGRMAGSIQDRVRDITDPKSQSALARDYRGESGPERQAVAQKQLHELMSVK